MFDPTTEKEIENVAASIGLEPAALLAVAEVESGGQAFAMVEGRREPLIRFEGHYFDQRLSEADRRRARAEGLSSPVAGEIQNPPGQAARWALLERAAAIDRKAAYESVSWGLGQVMGAHWAWLGFADVGALVDEARQGPGGQARLMARYIEKARLAEAIGNHDWEAFARGYNGPGYKRHGYHLKIAAAHARRTGRPAPEMREEDDPATALLGRGSRGNAVADLQRMLGALGHPLDADGQFGPATERAVKEFQRASGLPADGLVGPKTRAAIAAALPFGAGGAGLWRQLADWLKRRLWPG